MTTDQLRQVYEEKREEIRARLAQFEEIGRAGSDERLFEELTFCIFTAAASARMGLRSVERLRPVLMSGSRRDIQKVLRHAHRFPRARGAYVYETREYLRDHCGLGMRELLYTLKDPDRRRTSSPRTRACEGSGIRRRATSCAT